MHPYLPFLVSLLQLSAVTSASLLARQQSDPSDAGSMASDSIEKLCFPVNSTGAPNLDAPCNKLYDLESKCVYGANYTDYYDDDNPDNDDDAIPEASPKSQQKCICASQFWDYVDGCSNCERLHGAAEGDEWPPSDYLSTASSVYCGGTQTLGFVEFFGNYTESTTIPAAQSSVSDVLGNKTAVSLYWTAKSGDKTATGATATSTGTQTTGSAGTGATTKGSGSSAAATGAAGTIRLETAFLTFIVGTVVGLGLLL